MILDGTEQTDPTVTINSGATTTPTFTPFGLSSRNYPSVDVLYISYGGDYYLFTVSSATSTCNATISGLPTTGAEVLFEGRTVSTSGGNLTDNWSALGVHIYKID